MRFLLIIFFLACTFFPCFSQVVYVYKSAITGDSIKYLVYFPAKYSTKEKYPLLVFLHGMGEKAWPVGSINENVKKVGLPRLLASLKLPFIVVVPNCAYSDWDNIGYTFDFRIKYEKPGALPVEVTKIAQRKFSVDTSRIYITGISMGGGGAFSAIHNFPGVYAAAIPIAGWGNSSKACQTTTPVWAFQGSKDNGEGVRNVIEAIKKCQPHSESRCTVLEGKGHFIWDDVYSNKVSGGINIYDWLLTHRK